MAKCQLICVENVIAEWLGPQLTGFTLGENFFVGPVRPIGKTPAKSLFLSHVFSSEPVPFVTGGSCKKQTHRSRIQATVRGNQEDYYGTQECLRRVIECLHFPDTKPGQICMIRAVDGQPFALPDSPEGNPLAIATFDVVWREN